MTIVRWQRSNFRVSAREWRLPVPSGPNRASAGRRRASRDGQLSARGLSPEQTSRPPPTSPPTATHSPCRVCQSCLSPPFVCLSIVLALALIHHHLPSYTYLPYLTLVHRTRPPSIRSRHTCLTPACLLCFPGGRRHSSSAHSSTSIPSISNLTRATSPTLPSPSPYCIFIHQHHEDLHIGLRRRGIGRQRRCRRSPCDRHQGLQVLLREQRHSIVRAVTATVTTVHRQH